MNILIFIAVLALLIFVHELGHFIFAKKTGMLVEEFAIGFPPRIFSKQKGETKYSIGAIPLGGYCQILGENYDEAQITAGSEGVKKEDKDFHRRFTSQPKKNQALVLVAGVAFNFILAWILIAFSFMSGMLVSAGDFSEDVVQDPQLVLMSVLADSPAQKAGLEIGDTILYLETEGETLQEFKNVDEALTLIAGAGESEIEILYKRGEENILASLSPEEGLFEEGKAAIGVSFDVVGTVELGFFAASWEALKMTFVMIWSVATGMLLFITGIFTGSSSLSQVSGPVGIVGLVGNAYEFGFVYLMSFVAVISINLGVINLLPLPALDGGRLLFLGIEAIKGSPIKAKVVNTLNLVGFALLLLLMLVITISDVMKLF